LRWVVPQTPSDADPEAIREWCNARLAKTQRLIGVELRDDFPRNALGKVVKKDLRAALLEGCRSLNSAL